jgi:hypothetical protein
MPDAVAFLLVAIAVVCVGHLFFDAYRSFSREAAQLQGIELRADTSRRCEYSSALQAMGGRSW